MKVYKTEPNKYGWYLVIHKLKGGSLKIYLRSVLGNHKGQFDNCFNIWDKDQLDLLKKVLGEDDD